MVHRRRRSSDNGSASRRAGSGSDSLKKLTSAEVKKALEAARERREAEEERARRLARDRNVRTKATCVVCGGLIVDRRRRVHRPLGLDTPIGPSHRGPPSPAPHEGFHCRNCGLEYHKLPALVPLESRLLDRAHAAVWGFRLGILTEEEAENLVLAHAQTRLEKKR
jgi:hypothetical protein